MFIKIQQDTIITYINTDLVPFMDQYEQKNNDNTVYILDIYRVGGINTFIFKTQEAREKVLNKLLDGM